MNAAASGLRADDGRRLRREQNRDAVIDALLELFAAGIYTPSSADIAARAGLSPRSLFRYFDDVDDLHRAAADRQLTTALPLLRLTVGPADDASAKIEAIARARVRLFTQVSPAARALRVCAHRDKLLAGELQRNRDFLTRQLAELFAPEVARLPADRQLPTLRAADALCSFESFDLLSRDPETPPSVVVQVLVTALTALFARQRDGAR